jgi:uncharacterized membrane protein
MKFFLLSLLSVIPSVGICSFVLHFGIFHDNNFLYKFVALISYCAFFFIFAILFKLGRRRDDTNLRRKGKNNETK